METLELSPSLLEPLVAVVATLGELAATMRSAGDTPVTTSGVSWHEDLQKFIGELRKTLGHTKVTSLGEVLATLGATSGDAWAQVATKVSSWQNLVASLGDKWDERVSEAKELLEKCKAVANAEVTTCAGHRPDEALATCRRDVDNMLATAQCLPLKLGEAKADEAVAAHGARVARAGEKVKVSTKAVGDAVVATSQAKAATKRGQRAKMALGPLGRLVAECDKATALPRELLRRLGDIEADQGGTREDAVAAVAEVKRLWVASADLGQWHLLGILEDIEFLLDNRPGAAGDPSDDSVAERCQKAMEAIPGLLQGQ